MDYKYGFRSSNLSADRTRTLCICQILKKNGNTTKQCVSYLESFKENYDSVMREALYNSVIECVINMKLVILTNMCLNVTCNRV
jgi:hypothetical protein